MQEKAEVEDVIGYIYRYHIAWGQGCWVKIFTKKVKFEKQFSGITEAFWKMVPAMRWFQRCLRTAEDSGTQ